MSDHPVLIPTTEGPVGGIVSEPERAARAALVIGPGYGRPARSGINSFWTRLARDLADRGLVTLRIDYSREGETLPIGEEGSGQVWKNDLDMRLFAQAIRWFRTRLSRLDLFLAGACSGARGVIDLAGRDYPDLVARTFLIVPHLRVLYEAGRRGLDDGSDSGLVDPDAVDPSVVDCFRSILARAPSWILVGEHDSPDIALLQRLLGPTDHNLEVETVPGVALHLLDQPNVQDQVALRFIARIESALAELESSAVGAQPS